MADHIKAANSLESAMLLIADANNYIDPEDVKLISRLQYIIRRLDCEATYLRLSTLKIIKGDKE